MEWPTVLSLAILIADHCFLSAELMSYFIGLECRSKVRSLELVLHFASMTSINRTFLLNRPDLLRLHTFSVHTHFQFRLDVFVVRLALDSTDDFKNRNVQHDTEED
jgi:hypothetical protein